MKRKKKLILTFATILLVRLLCQCQLYAQGKSVQRDSIFSQILNENRNLDIVFPVDYNPDANQEYDIIYSLDGIYPFSRADLDLLQGEGFLPKNMIMVGIINTEINGINMRDRDFTPTKTSDISGGAARFLSFIKMELIPYLHSRYKGKLTGNTLFGSSLGGLFVVYAFQNDPSLFTSYIASDPSLWWDNFLLNRLAKDKFEGMGNVHNTLFIAGREGTHYRDMGTAGMDSILHTNAPAGLDWACNIYSNETHYSTSFKAFWDGLKFSYGGFYASSGGYAMSQRVIIKPMRGLVVKGMPFKLISYNLMASQYLHYTIDGSQPTKSSPTLAGNATPNETSIVLQSDSKIIVKSIGARDEYNRKDSAFFSTGSLITSILKPTDIDRGGLRFTYYEGDWNSTDSKKRPKPLKSGLADQYFDPNNFPSEKTFTCILDGYIEIPRSGYYVVEMGSGDVYSKVYMNNQQVLGSHFVPGIGENYMMPLEKGFHRFSIEYIHKKYGDKLEPVYLKPEGYIQPEAAEDFPIQPEMLYSQKKKGQNDD